jgi:hypothetical protein
MPSQPRTKIVSCRFYNAVMVRVLLAAFFITLLTAVGDAQTPQPFPRPGTAQPQRPSTPPAAPAPSAQQPLLPVDPNAPSAETLGVAVFPGAQFLASYDAGRGQRYYLFGTTASFAELLGYYRTQTGERGDLVFKDPPTQMFTGGTLARFREETMAFPPSVTVKDWTSGGSSGYPNPKIGAQPQRFPTVIMIVPPPPGTPAPR